MNRHANHGLLLGALMLAGLPALAADTIDTTGFSLTLVAGTPDDVTLELISATADTVHIRLDNLQASPFVATTTSGTEFDMETALAQLSGQVHDGYRITSLTLNVTASGNLDVPIYDSCLGCTLVDAGTAVNSGLYTWSFTQGAITTELGTDDQTSLDGMQFLTSTAVRTVTGEFGLVTRLDSESAASPLIWQQSTPFGTIDHVESSSASFYIGNAELVFEVALVVPEPGTWAMLLAGLGLLGVTARRRSA
jgi:hypothetical protein